MKPQVTMARAIKHIPQMQAVKLFEWKHKKIPSVQNGGLPLDTKEWALIHTSTNNSAIKAKPYN